jgi:hypothetical protein
MINSLRWQVRARHALALAVALLTLTAVPVLGQTADPSPIVASGDTTPPDPVAVEAVDWVSVADASLLEETAVTDVAVAPGGDAVIVGFHVKRTIRAGGGIGLRAEGRVWWSRHGSEWRSGTFLEPEGSRPSEVIATPDGFLATGVIDSDGAVIWTSTDGSEWSAETFDGAVFQDLDSVGDWVAIAGEQRAIPTVWISTAGGPWQTVTIADAGPGFMARQVALSAEGVYLVLDQRTGELHRSDDGERFRPVDLPDEMLGGADIAAIGSGDVDTKPGEAVGLSLTGDPTGFHLMVQHDGVDTLTAWASPDGLVWRPEVSLPASLWFLGEQGGRAFASGGSGYDLAFLQMDGTWCTVPSPAAGQGDISVLGMGWNDDGDMVVHGWPQRYGDPLIWYASGTKCGR